MQIVHILFDEEAEPINRIRGKIRRIGRDSNGYTVFRTRSKKIDIGPIVCECLKIPAETLVIQGFEFVYATPFDRNCGIVSNRINIEIIADNVGKLEFIEDIHLGHLEISQKIGKAIYIKAPTASRINIVGDNVTKITLSDITDVFFLQIHMCPSIKKVILPKFLMYLEVNGCGLSDVSHLFEGKALKTIQYVDLSANKLTDFDASIFPFADTINLSGNHLAEIPSFSENRRIKYIDLSYNPLKTLRDPRIPRSNRRKVTLKLLGLTRLPVVTLNIEKISKIYIGGDGIVAITLFGKTRMRRVWIQSDAIQYISIPNVRELILSECVLNNVKIIGTARHIRIKKSRILSPMRNMFVNEFDIKTLSIIQSKWTEGAIICHDNISVMNDVHKLIFYHCGIVSISEIGRSRFHVEEVTIDEPYLKSLEGIFDIFDNDNVTIKSKSITPMAFYKGCMHWDWDGLGPNLWRVDAYAYFVNDNGIFKSRLTLSEDTRLREISIYDAEEEGIERLVQLLNEYNSPIAAMDMILNSYHLIDDLSFFKEITYSSERLRRMKNYVLEFLRERGVNV